jgi:diguanylate cyclase (GGDEF)-like protein/PAS domain S-box-containing protein
VRDDNKTKQQLIDDLAELRQCVAELEASEAERERVQEAPRESGRLNELLLDSLPHPAMLIQRDRTILAANRIAEEIGVKVGGYCWRDFGHGEFIPDDHKRYISEHKGSIPPGGTKCVFCLADEALAKTKPTKQPEVNMFGQLWEIWWVPIEDGLYLHYTIDVTERKWAEQELRIKDSAIASSINGIAISDLQGNLTYVNPSFLEMWGYDDEKEVLGRSALQFWQQTEEAAETMRSVQEEGGWIGELVGLRKDGEIFDVQLSASVVVDDEGRPLCMMGSFVDITERKRAEETIKQLAYHDHLTGLPNRVLFNDRLKPALAQARRNQQRLAVMLLDLDRFKDANDTLGHPVGDELLQAVAERLTTVLRESDTVARMGGDEFLLILPGIVRVEDAIGVAQKILEALREPFALDGRELHITTSLGIAIYPDDGEDGDTLVKHVDIAMYRAKERGRDNYQRYTSL